ncbi:MAG: 2,3,4,5-tetrahydropyridine-2,6-dicarboxylate N-succinyltransferase [Alphaproteobacteria bacterium]|nr:2,3,4,5-tetrahydropyridine-2,6-dicarboxylate N-succinyltransferase [Alphaproteobacteria bacterium]
MSDTAFLHALETGEARVAQKDAQGVWQVDATVKQRILDYFAAHHVADMGIDDTSPYHGFVDKEGLHPRRFAPQDGVRLVPGGSSVRAGAFVARKVVIMPPAFVNIGAYIDEGTMVDSNALVGSCAYIGKYVHLSAGVQIGGVLEPVGQLPVIIEDNAFIGAGAAVLEGVRVGERAVVAAGTILSAATPIYDPIRQTIHKREVPANAVVVQGSRPLSNAAGIAEGLHIACPVIIKYRDDKTNAALQLEDFLR